MQAPSQGNRYLYRIVQSRPSPVVEMSKGLKHAIFRQETARKLTRLKRQYSHLAAILYVATFPIFDRVLFCGASEGQILAMISSSHQIPMMVFVVLSLRIDMLHLLSTDDFWSFSIMNFMTLILLASSFRDSRVVLTFFMWLNMQYNVSIDVTLSNSRSSILASFMYHLVLFGMVTVDAIPDTHTFSIWHHKWRALRGRDVLLATVSSLMYLLVKIIYRERVYSFYGGSTVSLTLATVAR